MAKTTYNLRVRLEQVGPNGERVLMSNDGPARPGEIVKELGEVMMVAFDPQLALIHAELAEQFMALSIKAIDGEINPREMATSAHEAALIAREKVRRLATNRISQN